MLYKKSKYDRKPNIGMFKIINKRWKVNKKKSFMIGDQITDIEFAKKVNSFIFGSGSMDL